MIPLPTANAPAFIKVPDTASPAAVVAAAARPLCPRPTTAVAERCKLPLQGAPRATRSFTAKTSCKDGREQERDVVNDEA